MRVSDLLLNYALSTNPLPLQVSTPSTPATGTVSLLVAARTVTAYCSRITVAVQVGDEAGSLFAQAPRAASNSTSWVPVAGLPPPKAGEPAYARVTFEQTAGAAVAAGLMFSLTGPVVRAPGTSMLYVLEHGGTVNDPATFTEREATLSVAVTPPQAYVRNFVATVNGGSSPATEFALGEKIVFAWESNGEAFQLFKKGETVPVYSGSDTTCTLGGGIATDTTFFLVASLGTPGGDRVVLYDALTLTVSNPALTPSSIVASGAVTVNGTVAARDASVAGTLTAATIDATTVSATTLNVAGTTTAAVLTAGELSARTGTLFGKAVAVTPGNYYPSAFTARTDGIIFARLAVVVVETETPMMWLSIATGAARGPFILSNQDETGKPATMSIPVAAGDQFFVAAGDASNGPAWDPGVAQPPPSLFPYPGVPSYDPDDPPTVQPVDTSRYSCWFMPIGSATPAFEIVAVSQPRPPQ
jgi:hypothetical protein